MEKVKFKSDPQTQPPTIKVRIAKPEEADRPDSVADEPVFNVVYDFDDPQNINVNIPLFIKKLWKIVNDETNESIIAWNDNGDAIVIHDQLKFISETLPRYFKHNQLSSFVRQLNLYDFHKTQPLENSEYLHQFTHPFFMRDLPQLLPLIKRKATGRTRKPVSTANLTKSYPEPPKSTAIVDELMNAIKDVKAKSDTITADMSKLRQENAALWRELNSLRVKYSKQTKIINKLIHFLIAYMQKHHHHTRKSGRTVSAANSNKYLKTGPKIMELDYRYRNNPHEFWSDFDSQHLSDHSDNEGYTVVEPAENHYEHDQTTNNKCGSVNEQPPPIHEVYSTSSQAVPASPENQVDHNVQAQSSSQASSSALQRSNSCKDNIGYLIDNSRMEISNLKELLRNLSPDEMTNFYKLVNDNYKEQEDELALEADNDLMSLSGAEFDAGHVETEIGTVNDSQAVTLPPTSGTNNYSGKVVNRTVPSFLDNNLDKFNQLDTPALPFDDIIAFAGNLENNHDLNLGSDLVSSEEALNNVAVDDFFTIN